MTRTPGLTDSPISLVVPPLLLLPGHGRLHGGADLLELGQAVHLLPDQLLVAVKTKSFAKIYHKLQQWSRTISRDDEKLWCERCGPAPVLREVHLAYLLH